MAYGAIGRRNLIFVLLLSVGAAGTARAEKFDDLAQGATRLADRVELGASFWSKLATCSSAPDDLARRQCEGIKAARGAVTAGRPLVVRADSSALVVGPWESAKSGLPVALMGCLACLAPVEVAGEKYLITTKGKPTASGDVIRGPEVGAALRKFASEAEARAFQEKVVPRLRAELVISIPPQLTAWTLGASKGISVELLGFRVHDACDGSIVLASPPAASVPPDRKSCGDEGVQEAQAEPSVSSEPAKEPELPQRLSPYQINGAMAKARSEVGQCFEKYGVPGMAKVTVEIGHEGRVLNAVVTGDFEGTPTGDCILEAVKKAEFPKFKQASMSLKDYPFILR
ncbi:MAG: hypothetical protein HY698_13695 [Deltaproteobacteria bacterium]|nr:hypothetical protein [Deltaproteobacteria bacterium]